MRPLRFLYTRKRPNENDTGQSNLNQYKLSKGKIDIVRSVTSSGKLKWTTCFTSPPMDDTHDPICIDSYLQLAEHQMAVPLDP